MEFQQPFGRIYNGWLRRFGSNRYGFSKWVVIIIFSSLIVGLYVVVSGASVVPKKIQSSVSFPVYYPKSLPAGYALDVKSFRTPEPGVVLFTVAHGEGKNIVFSEQAQPSSGDIDKFATEYIPLNAALQLPLGQAKIGAYGAAPNIRTVVSLPVRDGPWLIITAPPDVNRDDLIKILQALVK